MQEAFILFAVGKLQTVDNLTTAEIPQGKCEQDTKSPESGDGAVHSLPDYPWSLKVLSQSKLLIVTKYPICSNDGTCSNYDALFLASECVNIFGYTYFVKIH